MSAVLVAEVANELDSPWELKKLGDILKVRNGYAFKSTEYQSDGMLLIRQSNLDGDGVSIAKAVYLPVEYEKTYSGFLIENGDLLIGMSGSIGKLCLYDQEKPALQNQRTGLLRFRDVSLRKWVWYYLPLVEKELLEGAKGVAVQNVSAAQIEALPIPVPSIETRQRIIAELEKQFSRLDEAVANLQRVKANLKRYKASVLKDAVEGRLVPTEGNWKHTKLGEVALSVRNGYSHKPDADAGTRIFRISAVRPMELNVDDVRYLSGTPSDYESFLVVEGDVLFTRYNGSRDYVGVCAVVPAGMSPTVYPDKLIRVRVPTSALLPAFVVIAASTGRGRDFIESMIRTTAGQSGVSGSDIKAIPISIPPIDEQIRIVAEADRRLSLVRGVESEVDVNLKRAYTLRISILATAFHSGPNDV